MEYIFQYWWLPCFGIFTVMLYILFTKNNAAEKELADLQQHLMKANLEISKQQVKIAESTQQLTQKDSSIEDLLKEINADKRSQTDEQKTLDQLRAKIRKLQETISVVQDELTESRKANVTLQEDLKQEQDARTIHTGLPLQSLEQFQAKISALQKVIREQNDAISLLHQKRNMNEQQIEVLRIDVQNKSQQLHAAEAALQKRELELASSFASKDMSNVELQHSMVELEYSVKILEKQLEMEHLAQKNLTAKASETEEKLQNTVETLKQIIDGQNIELQEFKNRVASEDKLSADVTALQKKLTHVEQELQSEKNRIPQTQNISEESFAAIVKAVLYKAPVAAFLVNNKGSIQAVNNHFAELYGSAEDQVCGKDFGIIFSPEERDFIMEQWHTFESKENYFQGTIGITNVAGEKITVYFTLSFIPTSWSESFYVAYLLLV